MTAKNIENRIGKIAPVLLEELNHLKFMNRNDTKFVYPVQKIDQILDNLDDTYHILTIDGKRIFRYRNMYFDTPDFQLFTKHQNGKLNRHKVRYRVYIDTKTAYLELKIKSNKRKTLKKRIPYDYTNAFDNKAKTFIESNTPLSVDELQPSIITTFDRITLVSFTHNERITLDINLSYEHCDNNLKIELPYLGIAEVKSERGGNKANFIKYLRSLGIAPLSISKYCIGICLLKLNEKINRFKPKLLHLKKIENEFISNSQQSA